MTIAVIRLADVVARSHRGARADAEMKARLEALQKEVAETERKTLLAEAEARRLGPQRGALAKRSAAAKLRRTAEHAKREAEIAIEEMRRQLLDDVLLAVEPYVQEVAEAHDVDLVLLAPNPGLAYYKPSLDLTDEIIGRLDQEKPESGCDPK